MTRRLLNTQVRHFGLLVPLRQPETAATIADQLKYPLTEKYFKDLEAKYEAFNESCKAELQEMNQNIITDIIDRGGHEGWETEANLNYMQKSFNFKSFEEANAFVQHVSKFCNEKDHHPEWRVTDHGCTVNVKLTSHFAGNKVTRLDFELAEAMNNSYLLTFGRYRRGTFFNESRISDLKILFGTFVALSFVFNLLVGPKYPIVPQHYSGKPIEQEIDFSPALATRSQLIADKYSHLNVINWASVQLHKGDGKIREWYEGK